MEGISQDQAERLKAAVDEALPFYLRRIMDTVRTFGLSDEAAQELASRTALGAVAVCVYSAGMPETETVGWVAHVVAGIVSPRALSAFKKLRLWSPVNRGIDGRHRARDMRRLLSTPARGVRGGIRADAVEAAAPRLARLAECDREFEGALSGATLAGRILAGASTHGGQAILPRLRRAT